jgi:ABC-type nitrate/sulfonate/bicarbonate transport systems, periplasmic components
MNTHTQFRNGFLGALVMATAIFSPAQAEEDVAIGAPEKQDLKFGFIKLTDMAPLAIAKEKHFFFDEGLFVDLEAQSNWRVLLDRVIGGALDGAAYAFGSAHWRNRRCGRQPGRCDHRLQHGPQRQRHHGLQ